MHVIQAVAALIQVAAVMAAAAAQDATRAIAPEKAAVYSLVRIAAQTQADHYDVQVMSVQEGRIVFSKVQKTNQPGQWVFTGSPGVYAIRVTSFDKTKGFTSEVGETTIGNPPPDDDDAGPETIPGDRFGNLGRDVARWVSRFCSPNFPKKDVAKVWRATASRLEGTQEPILGTITEAFGNIKEGHEAFPEQTKQEWNSVKNGINERWKAHRQSIDRAAAVDFLRAVANWVAPPPVPAGKVLENKKGQSRNEGAGRKSWRGRRRVSWR